MFITLATRRVLRTTLSGSLPGDDDSSVDGRLLAEVDHPDGRLDVVVVHDGAVGQRRVGLAVDGQRRVAVAPFLPRVTLVVHPRRLTERLVGNWKKRVFINIYNGPALVPFYIAFS